MIPGIAFCVVYSPICRPTDQGTNQGVPCIGRFVSLAFWCPRPLGSSITSMRRGWLISGVALRASGPQGKKYLEKCVKPEWYCWWFRKFGVHQLRLVGYLPLFTGFCTCQVVPTVSTKNDYMGVHLFCPDWVNKSQLDSFLSMCFHESGR